MERSSGTNKVGIINGGRDRDGTGSLCIDVTKSKRKFLDLLHVSIKNIIMQDDIMRGTRSALKGRMTLQIEVILHGPGYFVLDNQAGVAVSLPVSFTIVTREKNRMVPFPHNDERHENLVISTPNDCLDGNLNSLQFGSRHGVVLSFQYSISEEVNPPWQNLPEFDKALERSSAHTFIFCKDSIPSTRDCCTSVSAAYLVAPSS